MLLYGVYQQGEGLYPASGLPKAIQTERSLTPGTLSRAFILAATPAEQVAIENDGDLRRLNQLLETPNLRNLWAIQMLTRTLEERYDCPPPADGKVYAALRQAPEIQQWVEHTPGTSRVGGVLTTREAAKAVGAKVQGYKIAKP